LRDEYTRTIEPARGLATETLTLERTLNDLVNQAYGLTPPETGPVSVLTFDAFLHRAEGEA